MCVDDYAVSVIKTTESTMAGVVEPIELSEPIWEQQEDEEIEYYLIFSRYYLPFALGGASRAHKRYLALHKEELEKVKIEAKRKKNDGTDGLGVSDLRLIRNVDVSNQNTWFMWEKKYQWKKRHQAYHLWRGAQDLEKLERRQSIQMGRITNLIDLSIDRAEEILQIPSTERQVTQVDENGNPLVIVLQPRPSKDYKDAMDILRAGQTILEDFGLVGKANRYIKFLHDHGFEVTEAGLLAESDDQNLLAPAGEDENDLD